MARSARYRRGRARAEQKGTVGPIAASETEIARTHRARGAGRVSARAPARRTWSRRFESFRASTHASPRGKLTVLRALTSPRWLRLWRVYGSVKMLTTRLTKRDISASSIPKPACVEVHVTRWRVHAQPVGPHAERPESVRSSFPHTGTRRDVSDTHSPRAVGDGRHKTRHFRWTHLRRKRAHTSPGARPLTLPILAAAVGPRRHWACPAPT